MTGNKFQPETTKSRFTPSERAQIRQLLLYFVTMIAFVILASLVVGILLNHNI